MIRLNDREKELENLLNENGNFNKVYYFDSLSSTNEIAKDIIKEDSLSEFILVSREQTRGKGRLERVWQSEKDAGLYLSIVKEITKPNLASMLSLLAGISTFKALRMLGVEDVFIKWPNDLLISKKKVSGILCELYSRKNVFYAIIGIGVNVNNRGFGEELEYKATSLLMEKYNIDILDIAHKIVLCFEKVYNDFVKVGDLSQYQEFLNQNIINIGKPVEASYGNKIIKGTALAVCYDGSLRVDVDGKMFDIRSGEVSLEGYYGK